jgi:hypothetical protein
VNLEDEGTMAPQNTTNHLPGKTEKTLIDWRNK